MDAYVRIDCVCSIFAAKTVIFDDSLGLSIELRTAYTVFIILSMVVAAVSVFCRIYSAHNVHQVRYSAQSNRFRVQRHLRGGRMNDSARLQAINRHVSNRPSNFWDGAPRGAVSEETNDTAEFMQKLEWELTKIGRDLVDCALLCLTLCIEGANPRFKPRVCRPLVYGA